MTEAALRAAIVRWSRSLFDRGLTGGSSGNISVRLDDGWLATPTNACLGFLDPDRLARLDARGAPVSGDPPTKELPLHFAFYEHRPQTGAVVHLHAAYSTALSCLPHVDPTDAIPPLTPYAVMRVGRVPVLPYLRPGSDGIAPLIAEVAAQHSAVLLANHGPVVSAPSLDAAVYAMEELEAAARIAILTHGLSPRLLDAAAVEDLDRVFQLR